MRRAKALSEIVAASVAIEPELVRGEIAERWDTTDPQEIRDLAKFDGEFYRNLGIAFGAGAIVSPALGLVGIGTAVALNPVVIVGCLGLAGASDRHHALWVA